MTVPAELADNSPTQGLYVTHNDGNEALQRALAMAADYRGDAAHQHRAIQWEEHRCGHDF